MSRYKGADYWDIVKGSNNSTEEDYLYLRHYHMSMQRSEGKNWAMACWNFHNDSFFCPGCLESPTKEMSTAAKVANVRTRGVWWSPKLCHPFAKFNHDVGYFMDIQNPESQDLDDTYRSRVPVRGMGCV
jgi:hypothetical protein